MKKIPYSNHEVFCLYSQIIDLNDNTVIEEGSAALAEVIPNLQELRVLNLGDCLVRDDGARAIAGAIKDGQHHLKVCMRACVCVYLSHGFVVNTLFLYRRST